MYKTLLIGAIATLVPAGVFAEVTISEIMYDLEGTDTDREWVELYNGGSAAVDITGWKINDGSNHVLNEPPKNGSVGSMTISPGGYLVLAADAPTFTAMYPSVSNVLDTVLSLNNTGDTISLINAEGATIDSITYSKETGAAGDGNSLHRGSGGSTLTPGAPSPGSGTIPPAVSSGSSSHNSNTSSGSSSSNSSGGGTQKSESNSSTAPKFTISLGKDRTVIAGTNVQFEATAQNSEKKRIDGATFAWSFGDGGKGAEGANVSHQFTYPGRYIVVLNAGYQEESATARIVVEAIAADIAFLVFSDGGVSIENKARMELDLSLWKVRDQGKTFTVPANTIVLPGASIRLAPQTLGFFVGSKPELLSPNEALIFHPGETKQEVVATQSSASRAQVADVKKESPRPIVRAAKEKPKVEPESTDVVEEASAPVQNSDTQAAVAASAWEGNLMWWGGAGAVALLGAGAAFIMQRARKKEWNIVDDSDDV